MRFRNLAYVLQTCLLFGHAELVPREIHYGDTLMAFENNGCLEQFAHVRSELVQLRIRRR